MRSTTEFISYNARKLRIHGDALRTRHYSGQFNARDPESFIDYLRQDDGIEIVDIQGGLVVTPHSSDTKFSHPRGHVAFQFSAFGF
jgi:ferric-dicitrate binding protein FerR (iron transport regulator)